MSIGISLHSEFLKIRRTSSVYLCFILSALIPLLLLIETLAAAMEPNIKTKPFTAHFLMGQETLLIFFFPLFVLLVSTLLLQMEYRNHTWKQVLAAPQSHGSIFLSKFLSFQFLIFLFILVYHLYLFITAIIVELAFPQFYGYGLNGMKLLQSAADAYMSILAMSALQFWMALRFRNFIKPIAIGACLWFGGLLLLSESRVFVAMYYPYTFPVLHTIEKYKVNIPLYNLVSVIEMVIISGLAFLDFKFKRVRV